MGRRRTALSSSLLAAALLASIAGPAHAVRPGEAPAGGLEVPHGSRTRARGPLRAAISATWGQPPQQRALAWSRFLGDAGAGWRASWDDATRVPSRITGRGVAAPGTVADGGAAARHARAFLARHVELLAPGADASDFVLVSNRARAGLRVVGFRQTHQGLVVQGGQVSFRYKNDRLFVIGSEALPHVAVAPAFLAADADAARSFATAWVLSDAAKAATPGPVGAPFILPLVGAGGTIDYRVVRAVDVEAREPIGRYRVYTDASIGSVVAREQTLRFAAGNVRYRVPVRSPQGERDAYAARRASLVVDGATVESDDDGGIAWTGTGPGDLTMRARGPLVDVSNDDGDGAQLSLSISSGGTATWDAAEDELVDAQVTAFIHAGIVKDYARAHLAPDMEWLDEQLPVVVNIAQSCNAFSDGNSINFFQKNAQCENTGRLADVVYHEFGHSLHSHALIEGVGAFDGAHSEGLSDYLAASITGDPAMGRGFFLDDSPLRHIDPLDKEAVWPRDVAQIHTTGLIFAGAMWDLRKLLIKQHGEVEGAAIANRLFFATLERATSIPTTYTEVLAEDDDDGDLSNGTPNACEIATAFGAHGLRALTAQVTPLSAEMPGEEGFAVAVEFGGLFAQCPGDGVASATLAWHLRGGDPAEAETIEMAAADDGSWVAAIPPVDTEQVVRYSINVEFLDGGVQEMPSNPADRHYEFYVGEVVPLYCTDFETDPFEDGWTHGLSSGASEEGADDWAWGAPAAPRGAGDPAVAFSGEGVIGNDLGGEDLDGLYQPDKINFAQTPVIDVERYSDVHVQYWRWLTVEDAFFDRATLYANDEQAWQNLNSDVGEQSATQHLDAEWRFQDVPVSQHVADGSLQIRFEMASDGGLEFGGWTVDDFCVVANPASICGDGELSGAEDCDDGDDNIDGEPDACRTNCRAATCGDGVVDSGESCDDGNTVEGDDCSATCGAGDDGGDCGCQVAPHRSAPGRGAFALLVAAAGVLLVARRRRRTCR